MKSRSICACGTPCACASSAKKDATPSERVGPGSTALTVTPVPAVSSANPRDTPSSAVLLTP